MDDLISLGGSGSNFDPLGHVHDTSGGALLILHLVEDVSFPRRPTEAPGGWGPHSSRLPARFPVFDNAATRAAAYQRQRNDHLAQPALGDHQLEPHPIFLRRGLEGVIQCDASLVRSPVDELVAHPVLGR
jgi:hypothetical protein